MRTKILKKVFALGTTAAIVACLPQFSVGAASNTFKKRLLGNLSQCTYHTNNTYNIIYGDKTRKAASDWEGNYQAFTMNWSKTTSTTATILFTTMSNSSSTTLGITRYYSPYHSNFSADDFDWTYCIVSINTSKDIQTSTITHEIGHVLGLKHRNTVPDSIMCQMGFGRTATVPSDFDRALVTMKYYNQ